MDKLPIGLVCVSSQPRPVFNLIVCTDIIRLTDLNPSSDSNEILVEIKLSARPPRVLSEWISFLGLVCVLSQPRPVFNLIV